MDRKNERRPSLACPSCLALLEMQITVFLIRLAGHRIDLADLVLCSCCGLNAVHLVVLLSDVAINYVSLPP